MRGAALIAGFSGIAVLLTCGPGAAADAPPLPTGPRAYRVSVFDKPATDRLRKHVAEGLVVLADRVIRFSEVSDPKLRDDFLSRYHDIYFATELDPTGCFTLTNLGSEHGSIGVLAPYGLVGWQPAESGGITGRLYQSPDSAYDLTITERGDRLDGVGKGALGFRGGAMLVEYFDGVRLPDAGLGECFQDAAALLRQSRPSAP